MKLWVKVALGFGVLLIIPLVMLVVIFVMFNSKSPRDLGITYTEADLQSGREKSQIVYEAAPANTKLSDAQSWQTFGKREVDTEFTSSEITAIMNNKPGIYYPYTDVQVKFNADGSGEISGKIIKSRIPIYTSTFGAPYEVVDFVMRFLPEDPVFYLKGRATLVDNTVGIFEPQRLEIGRVPIPLGPILSGIKGPSSDVFALDLAGMLSELSQYDNKEQLIINYINEKLAGIEGFYAEEARMEEDKLVYEGTLPEKEVTVR